MIWIKRISYFLLLIWSLNAFAAESTEQVQKKIQALESKLKGIELNIKRTEKHISTEQKNLSQTDKTIQKITLSLNKTQHSITYIEKNIEHLVDKMALLEKEKEALLQRLEVYIQKLSHDSQRHPLKIILKQQKITDVQKLSVWYEYFAKAEAKLLKDLRLKVKQSEAAKQEHSLHQETLIKLREIHTKQQQNLKLTREKQLNLIEHYQTFLERDTHSQDEIKAQHKGLTLLLAKLEQASKLEYVELPKQFQQMIGQLPMPILANQLQSVVFSDSYLFAKEGTQVHAIHPGRVVFSEWLRGLGLLIIIDHGQGYMSLYGNNQALLKSTGDWVKQGDQISLVGKSGGQSKPGLYFEIRKNGYPLDSRKWIHHG